MTANKSSKSRNKIRDFLAHFILLIFASIVCLLPRKVALRLGVWIGEVAFQKIKKRRQIALKNLEIAFGDSRSKREIKNLCREHFHGLGKNLIEFLQFPKINKTNIADLIEVKGRENIDQALIREKGIILFIPHFGNWEMLALAYGTMFPQQVKAIAFPLKNRAVNKLVQKYREQMSIELIAKKSAIRHTLKAFNENFIVGFLADQHAGENGIKLDFLGQSTSAERSPVLLALRTQTPLIFSIAIRLPDNRHRITILPPMELEVSGNRNKDLQINTKRLFKILESYINKYPSQWLWIHDRWKTKSEKG